VQLAAIVGITIAIALAHVSLAVPILTGALGVVLLAVVMTLFMRETTFHSTPGDSWAGMGRTFLAGTREVKAQPVLVLIFVITAIFGAFSEGVDRLFTPYLITSFDFPAVGTLDTVVWWGIIAAVSSVVGFVVTTLARRYVDLTSHKALTWVLGAMTALIGVMVAVFANLDSFYGVLALFWVMGGLRAARGPLSTAWLNRRLPSASRATLLSMNGQADAVGQAFGGPVVGVIAKQATIGLAMTVSALMLLPSLVLYRRAGQVSDTSSAS
jgi:DHA3 family tetracycline resistance protein-like MFS transporter